MACAPTEALYQDSKLRKRTKNLARRYFRAYPQRFDDLGYLSAEDLEDELWVCAFERALTDPAHIINSMLMDIHDMLRLSSVEYRMPGVDIMGYADVDDFGMIEDQEHVMSRLVCEGAAAKVC